MTQHEIFFNDDWRYDLKVGRKGENHFSRLLRKGKEFYTVEVKTDQQMDYRQNIFIEVESRNKPSGINRTEADYWFIQTKDYRFGFIIETELLRQVLQAHESDLKRGGDDNTSLGYLIGLPQLMRTILQYA